MGTGLDKSMEDKMAVLKDDIFYYEQQYKKLVRDREINAAQIQMYENMIRIGKAKLKEYEDESQK